MCAFSRAQALKHGNACQRPSALSEALEDHQAKIGCACPRLQGWRWTTSSWAWPGRTYFGELVALLAEQADGEWTATGLVNECAKHRLLQVALAGGATRSKATRMGSIAGRYLAELFKLSIGGIANLERFEVRDGNVYRVEVTQDLRNL